MNDESTPESFGASQHAADGQEFAGDAGARASQFDPRTAGGMIRAARQAQGIDLASLAAMLKIPLRRLEALEAGRHDELQGPTFERALAQAACRVLKIDPKPVLELLPAHERNTLERVTEGINTPFRDGQQGSGIEIPSVMRPVVVIVVLLLLGAIALFAMPESLVAKLTKPFTSAPAASAPAEAPVASAAAVPVELVPASGAASAPAAAASMPIVAAAPASAASVPAVLAPAAVSATAAQGVDEVLAHQAAAPNIPLQVIASADSWVEVVDAQGHSLLSRTVVAGESVGLDGSLPMKVKIGNARGTKLKLRGDNVDLTPWTRDNVARLELK